MEAASTDDLDILILGAGMAGILAGIKLREAGLQCFEILEMADAVGGTWRDNTYPGLACDVPAHNYDFTFEHNWTWSGLYAKGPELKAYFEHCADAYGVTPHVRFNTRVTHVEHVDGRWQVTSQDGTTRSADVVINCMGILCHPKVPDIPGLARFEGDCFHSARWDHSVPLDGRRIGVIGTGSTATQITSALAERAGHFSLFQRTAQWVCPALDTHRPGLMRQMHRWVPGVSRLTGSLQGALLERVGQGVTGDSPTAARVVAWLCRRHLATVRDPDLRARLTPDYTVGCRRLIFSDGFYEAIQQPTAELVTAGIDCITPTGVRTVDGRDHPLDLLVLATGFHALDYTHKFDVVNAAGESLAARWANGADAHRGVAVSGYPNYFMLIGPRSPVGNFGLTSIAESQMGYLMPLIERLRIGQASQIDVCPDAEAKYQAHLDAGVGKTAWASGCNKGWYLNAAGKPMLYPYTPNTFRRAMRAPDWGEYLLR